MDEFAAEMKEKSLMLGVRVTDLLLIHIVNQLASIAESQAKIVELAMHPPVFEFPFQEQSPLVLVPK